MTDDKAMLLAHTVFKSEGWQDSADKIIAMINSAGKKYPGKPRILVLDIEGHRTQSGAFDHDMFVLQHDIVNQLLSPWLAQVDMPLIHYQTNPDKRRPDSDLPLRLEVDGDMLALCTADEPERA